MHTRTTALLLGATIATSAASAHGALDDGAVKSWRDFEPAEEEQVDPNVTVDELGSLHVPTLKVGVSSTYGLLNADADFTYTNETRPGGNFGAERLGLELDLRARGRHEGGTMELARMTLDMGGYNGQWSENDVLRPGTGAEVSVDLALGGKTAYHEEYSEDVMLGKMFSAGIGRKSLSVKLGPVSVLGSMEASANIGVGVTGAFHFAKVRIPKRIQTHKAKQRRKYERDLGVTLSLQESAGGAVRGSASMKIGPFRAGFSTSAGLMDGWWGDEVTLAESGVTFRTKVDVKPLTLYLRVWAKAWFKKYKKTLLDTRVPGLHQTWEIEAL